jgi:hypothetical protein
MRTTFVFLVLIFGLAQTLLAQNRQITTPPTPGVTFEIAEQPGCPIDISLNDRLASRVPAAPLNIKNVGPSKIAAFVLQLVGDPYTMTQTVIVGVKGLDPGATHLQALPHSRQSGSQIPILSVDYVQYADGTTWGADVNERSKEVRSYLDGQALALKRLYELLGGEADPDITKALNVFGGSSFSMPVFPDRKEHRDDFPIGYEGVVNMVRHSRGKDPQRSEDLAHKLESMPKTQ